VFDDFAPIETRRALKDGQTPIDRPLRKRRIMTRKEGESGGGGGGGAKKEENERTKRDEEERGGGGRENGERMRKRRRRRRRSARAEACRGTWQGSEKFAVHQYRPPLATQRPCRTMAPPKHWRKAKGGSERRVRGGEMKRRGGEEEEEGRRR